MGAPKDKPVDHAAFRLRLIYINDLASLICTPDTTQNMVMTEGIIKQRQRTPGTGHIFIGKNITPGIIIQQEKAEKAVCERAAYSVAVRDSIYLETIFG